MAAIKFVQVRLIGLRGCLLLTQVAFPCHLDDPRQLLVARAFDGPQISSPRRVCRSRCSLTLSAARASSLPLLPLIARGSFPWRVQKTAHHRHLIASAGGVP